MDESKQFIQKVGHTEVNKQHRGWLWLKHYNFEKIRVYRNRQGEVENEVPFDQTAYVIVRSHKDREKSQHIWLTQKQLCDLKEMIDEEIEGLAVTQ
jgi:hypothetical protein